MRSKERRGGFTLIELMIAVIVIGVLAVVAMPIFLEQIRKSRRVDGINALAGLQQAQERYRSSNATYAGPTQLTTNNPGLGLSATSGSGYYTLAITSADNAGYVASATAVSGTSQAADSACSTLWVRMASGNLRFGAGSTADWADPNRCWAR